MKIAANHGIPAYRVAGRETAEPSNCFHANGAERGGAHWLREGRLDLLV
jgi:hypothetical protein